MCFVCIYWEKGKLTDKEALTAIDELVGSENVTLDHAVDLAWAIEMKNEEQGSKEAE